MSRIFLGVILLGFTGHIAAQAIDREQLIRLVEGAQPSISDFAFEYEGSLAFPPLSDKSLDHPMRLRGVQETYTGSFARNGEGVVLVEIYYLPTDPSLASHVRTTTRNETTETAFRRSNSEKANITRSRSAPERAPGTGNFARLLLSDLLVGMLRAHMTYQYEGTRDVDGRSCLFVRVLETDDPQASKDDVLANLFWVDLERGAHALRHELWLGQKKLQAATNIRLRQFRAPSGKRIWLPVLGQFESYVTTNPNERNSPVLTINEPVSVETYDLLEYTLRFEQGLNDEYFSVNGRAGDIVSDELKKAKYEFGQYLVRTRSEKHIPVADAEIQENLDKMLKDSAVLARELKASSPARSGPNWVDSLPWAVAVLASITLVVLLVRRHFAA